MTTHLRTPDNPSVDGTMLNQSNSMDPTLIIARTIQGPTHDPILRIDQNVSTKHPTSGLRSTHLSLSSHSHSLANTSTKILNFLHIHSLIHIT